MNDLRIPWSEMDALISAGIEEYRSINSGIHMALIGTTRGGKTTLATGGDTPGRGILSHFEDVLVLDTTADPGSISRYGKPLSKYGAIRGHRRLTVGDMSTDSKLKIHKAIQKAYAQGNVAIYCDEVRQLCEAKWFGMKPTLEHLWLYGAKKGVSVIGSTQAPRWIPSAFYEQSKMHIVFGVRNKTAKIRLSEFTGDTDTLLDIVPLLQRFDFAHVGVDGDVAVSRFELKSKPSDPKVLKVGGIRNYPEKRLIIQRGSAHGLTPTR